MMARTTKTEFRYEPKYCTILKKHVWAILTRQPDGVWRIVNCLDKDQSCFTLDCRFTAERGEWPYRGEGAPLPPLP